jgi:hypothetical protein
MGITSKYLEELQRLGSQTTEEMDAFAAALESHGPNHPRTLEHADLILFRLRRELDAMDRIVREWQAAHERQLRRDLAAAERDARDWLEKYPD